MKYELEFTTQAKRGIKRLDKGIQPNVTKKLASCVIARILVHHSEET